MTFARRLDEKDSQPDFISTLESFARQCTGGKQEVPRISDTVIENNPFIAHIAMQEPRITDLIGIEFAARRYDHDGMSHEYDSSHDDVRETYKNFSNALFAMINIAEGGLRMNLDGEQRERDKRTQHFIKALDTLASGQLDEEEVDNVQWRATTNYKPLIIASYLAHKDDANYKGTYNDAYRLAPPVGDELKKISEAVAAMDADARAALVRQYVDEVADQKIANIKAEEEAKLGQHAGLYLDALKQIVEGRLDEDQIELGNMMGYTNYLPHLVALQLLHPETEVNHGSSLQSCEPKITEAEWQSVTQQVKQMDFAARNEFARKCVEKFGIAEGVEDIMIGGWNYDHTEAQPIEAKEIKALLDYGKEPKEGEIVVTAITDFVRQHRKDLELLLRVVSTPKKSGVQADMFNVEKSAELGG